MGDYNADKNYNLPKMEIVSRKLGFIPSGKIFSDQWSIDIANRVVSFADGTNRIKLKVKFDPRQMP